MLSYINKYHRNYKKEAEIQKKRVELVYQYRFKQELKEYAINAKERDILMTKWLNKTLKEGEYAKYIDLVARKIELDSILKAGKEKITVEVGNKF